MPELTREAIERYLERLTGSAVEVCRIGLLGAAKDVKTYGYGVPVRVDYRSGGQTRSAVLHTITPGSFGHERMPDRAQELLWEHQAFNDLPRHVRSLDVCGFEGGDLVSLRGVEEFGLLTEYLEGQVYAEDLERLRDGGEIRPSDRERADALCDYLVEIHGKRAGEPGLYTRRVRELVGSGECIMGVADSYGGHPLAAGLEKIERMAVAWRWRLKHFPHRLSQVHGDFHPWNILFRSSIDFSVLDRSRGEYGDPADDVTCLTLNYAFFSLQRSGRVEGGLADLFFRFWDRYLERSGDREMLRVAAPFLAFRGLVMASPVWYPALSEAVRRKILALVAAVLEKDHFDPRKINDYCEP